MSSPAVETVRMELQQAIDALKPRLAGLRLFAALNLAPPVRNIIQQEIDRYERRLDFLQRALAALDVLVADDYPDLPPIEIDPALYAILQTALDELLAAFADFETPTAQTVIITPGEPELKD